MNEIACLKAKEFYSDVESVLMPYLISRSKKISSYLPGVDFEDAMQEGRLALFIALSKQNKNVDSSHVNKKLVNYMGRVLVNAYNSLIYKHLTKSKVPYISSIDVYGKKIKKPVFPLSLDWLFVSKESLIGTNNQIDFECLTPEEQMLDDQLRDDVGRFTMKMYNKLGRFDLDVFKCRVHPPVEFLRMLYNDGVDFVTRKKGGDLVLIDEFKIKNLQIAKFLGRSKNSIDFSIRKIKALFTSLAKNEFSDLFSSWVNNKRGWSKPMIHMTRNTHEDMNFVRVKMRERGLDTKQIGYDIVDPPSSYDDDTISYYSRLIRRYPWGNVVVLKRGSEYITLVIEGKFNKNTGNVISDSGAREIIPVWWYPSLVKSFK